MGTSGSKTPRATTKEGRRAGQCFDDVELHVISLTYKDLAGLSKGDKHGESIDKATFLQNFPVPGLVGDRLFQALDSNKSGRISFDDFIVGLAVCCRGTMEEKMRFIFGVYDMDGDGFISRDELLLMLNQVPRTLLNIGGDMAERDISPPLTNHKNLTLGGESKLGSNGPPHPPSIVTPHSSRPSSGKFFSGGSGYAPPSAPSARNYSRSRSVEIGRRGEGGESRRDSISAFTNESIAEQALRDFGGGKGKPLTFDQFERWAQQTPAVQALLQGAFPTDAHFSLATSPRARRVSCESLTSFDSPRRPSGSFFGTPIRHQKSGEAAKTAVAAVAAWSASASASRPASVRGTLGHQQHQSFGLNGAGESVSTHSVGMSFFSGNDPPIGARTPSRHISRNMSYDSLLRSPLVGGGVGMVASSPVPRVASVRCRLPSEDGYKPTAENGGEGRPGDARQAWKWGQQDGWSSKTPKASTKAGMGGGWNDDERKTAGAAAPNAAKGGILKDRDRSIPAPLTTVSSRMKPSNAPYSSGPVQDGPSPAVNPEPLSLSVSSAGVRGSHRRSRSLNPSGDGIPSSRPPQTINSSSGGGSRSSSDYGGPPKTPRPGVDRRSPPSTTEVTRKARKLAMMAMAAETASNTPGASVGTSCEDLLALANAAAARENPSQGPRRGKLMRYLSQDGGGTDSWRGNIAGKNRLMRLVSQDSIVEEEGEGGRRKKGVMKRTVSMSSPSVKKNGGKVGTKHGFAPRGGDYRTSKGVAPACRESSPTPRSTEMTSSSSAPSEDFSSREASRNEVTQKPMPTSPRARTVNSTVVLGSNNEAGGTPKTAGSGGGDAIPRNGGSDKTAGASKDHNNASAAVDVPQSADVSLGLPRAKISPLFAANDSSPVAVVNWGGGDVVSAQAGAEAVVRDCLYNSHGMVALDGYLWKPGSMRLVRRWMMLVDNTLYYFIRPGDRKPRGVISLPGCIAEAVSSDDDSQGFFDEDSARKESRKSRVPNGYFGLRLFRPNHHGRDTPSRLLLAKSAQERDEWVAELRVASRVVPLEQNFEIKALLRKGAFASVHKCVRKESGEEFAVKVIDKTSLSSHEKFLLRGEIGALKLVSHPNVVRLEAVHEDPRTISIVMTLCRGGDLWDKVRSQPNKCFTTNQARTVMRPLCEAVLYLHTLGILHRDIKPENILLVDDGLGNLEGVTLSDFGFSHQVSPKSRLACGKQLMGTPSYMAPESILHGMYGKEVDWFSCGCVLYMMLMGRAPFAGNSPAEIFRNTCHGRLGLGRGGASLWDKLPSTARELIVGLMQLDHNIRFTGEQAMNHRWLAMLDDDTLIPVGGGGGEIFYRHESGEEGGGRRGSRRRESESTRNGSRSSRGSLSSSGADSGYNGHHANMSGSHSGSGSSAGWDKSKTSGSSSATATVARIGQHSSGSSRRVSN